MWDMKKNFIIIPSAEDLMSATIQITDASTYSKKIKDKKQLWQIYQHQGIQQPIWTTEVLDIAS